MILDTFSPTAGPTDKLAQTATTFTLELPPFARESFNATLSICTNPCCPCDTIEVICRSATQPSPILRFSLTVFGRKLGQKPGSNQDEIALGRAFHSEMGEQEWTRLGELFRAWKLRLMESLNIGEVHARFPVSVTEGENTMVAYHEIFPWAAEIQFRWNAETWNVTDYYCVYPGCTCTEVGLELLRGTSSRQQEKPFIRALFLFYDYAEGTYHIEETAPGLSAPEQICQALLDAHPTLAETARNRHEQMKYLGRPLWEPAGRPQIARAIPRPGRNDPCPCGSGKKFKKCCGKG